MPDNELTLWMVGANILRRLSPSYTIQDKIKVKATNQVIFL